MTAPTRFAALLHRLARSPFTPFPVAISGGPFMPADIIATLRKRSYHLEALPETITIPPHEPERPDPIELALETATVDDIAFAIAEMDAAFSALANRQHALRTLYRLAREAGALGADNAAAAVVAGAR